MEAKAPVEKVGLIACSRINNSYKFEIYLADSSYASNPGIVWTYPTIDPVSRFYVERAYRSHLPAVCLLNSFLYMFEDYHPCLFPRYKPKSAYKSSFPISPDLVNRQTQDPTITQICTMHYGKAFPKALPVPGGKKILVFSTEFNLKDSYSAFELFDPINHSFRKCPPLPTRFHDRADCGCGFCTGELHEKVYRMEAYSFIGKSHFVLQMPYAAFALDLKTLVWTTLHLSVLPLQDPELGFGEQFRGRFKTFKGGRYALLPSRSCPYNEVLDKAGVNCSVTLNVHDVGNLLRPDARPWWCCVHQFLVSSMPPPYPLEKWPNLDIVSMEIEEGEEEEGGDVCNTCIVQQDGNDEMDGLENLFNRFLIDFCRTDFATLETVRTGGLSLRINTPGNRPFDFIYFTLN